MNTTKTNNNQFNGEPAEFTRPTITSKPDIRHIPNYAQNIEQAIFFTTTRDSNPYVVHGYNPLLRKAK